MTNRQTAQLEGPITEDGTVLLEDFLTPVRKPAIYEVGEVFREENQISALATRNLLVWERELLEQKRREVQDNVIKLHLQEEEAQQFSQFPKLDLSFLSMGQTIKYQGEELRVPRFAIYPFFVDGDANFSFSTTVGFPLLDRSVRGLWKRIRDGEKYFYDAYNEFRSLGWRSVSKTSANSVGLDKDTLRGWFDDATDLKGHPFASGYDPRSKVRRIHQDEPTLKKYLKILENPDRRGRGISFGRIYYDTKFLGFIPDGTKENVRKARKTFGIDDIYLITEVSPENWQITHESHSLVKSFSPTSDPLLVGFDKIQKNCYLIDHFNTTPIERYVVDEFSESKC